MMRSMFSGVSGLRTHQTRMDVIGNNVANVNTVGFKSGRVTFQEVFNQTLRGAGAPDAALGRGGTNPMQIGLGTGVGAIDTIMTRGSAQRTDNPTDLSIEGEGFFVVKGSNADTFKFTRAGNFGLDKLGNLVSGSGMNVYGWMKYDKQTDGTVKFDTEAEIKPINVYNDDDNGNKRVIAPKATTNAVLSGNLNSSLKVPAATTDPDQFTVPLTAYDSLGNAHELSVSFRRTGVGAPSTWQFTVGEKTTDPATGQVTYPPVQSGATDDIEFDVNGKMTTTPATFEIEVDGSTLGADDIKMKLDFSNVTMFAADCSVKPTNVDGYTTGNLVTFNIGSDGMLTGIYSNGQQQPLGMVALASFSNPAGLQKVGDNLFIPTTNSGDFNKAVQAGSEGVGSLSPGTLEMSNVDLSREFTDMIITQRGFQANSRIITTSDEMLQELVNLKR